MARTLRRSARLQNKAQNYTDPSTDNDSSYSESLESECSTESDEYSPSSTEESHCICNKQEDDRIMICCDHCNIWYHHNCVHLTVSKVHQLSNSNKKWFCPLCKKKKNKNKNKKKKKNKNKNKNKNNNNNKGKRKRKRNEMSSNENNQHQPPQKKRRKNNKKNNNKKSMNNSQSQNNMNNNNCISSISDINDNDNDNDNDNNDDMIHSLVGIPLTPQQSAIRSFFNSNLSQFSECNECDDNNNNNNNNNNPSSSPLTRRRDFELPFAPKPISIQNTTRFISSSEDETEENREDPPNTNTMNIIPIRTTTSNTVPFIITNRNETDNESDTDLEILNGNNNNNDPNSNQFAMAISMAFEERNNNDNNNNNNNKNGDIEENEMIDSDDDDILIQAGDKWIESVSFLKNKDEFKKNIKEKRREDINKYIDKNMDIEDENDFVVLNENKTAKQEICPLTLKKMQDPIKNALCSHRYEKEAILNYQQYLIKHDKSRKCPQGGCQAFLWITS